MVRSGQEERVSTRDIMELVDVIAYNESLSAEEHNWLLKSVEYATEYVGKTGELSEDVKTGIVEGSFSAIKVNREMNNG